MADIILNDIVKIYEAPPQKRRGLRKAKVQVQPKRAVDGLTLTIPHGSFTVLVGPSGCGKTTLLRMIAGLEEITEGEIRMGDINITNLEPGDRGLAMVFQNYALYPHMTVRENIEFGLVNARLPRFEIRERVQKALDIVGMGEYADRRPGRISGGQRQRVALARAISKMPECFLMDEPLSNLDAKLRNQMRAEIIKLREKIDTTFVYVTHDQVEAMTLGDRIVIMRDGFIQQIGTPQEVFNHPANLFVAGFIGTPQMNLFDAALSKKGDKYVATILGRDFELPEAKQTVLKAMDKVPSEVIVGVRPVHVHLADDGIDATVDVSELMGSELHLHVNSAGKDVVIVVPTTDIDIDSVHGGHKAVKYSFRPDLMHFFDKETEKNLF